MVAWREAKVHVLTHGLHYASCVFEGARVYNGQAFKLHEHSKRLVRSAELMGFKLPYTADELGAAPRAALAANHIVDGYPRPVACRGPESMAAPATHTTLHVAIATWGWSHYFSQQYNTRGTSLHTPARARP